MALTTDAHGSRHLTNNGATEVAGLVGNCAQIGAGNYLSVPSDSGIEFLGVDFYIAFFVRFDTLNGSWRVPATKRPGPTTGGEWQLRIGPGDLLQFLAYGTGGDAVIDCSTTPVTGQWYFVEFGVKDGGTTAFLAVNRGADETAACAIDEAGFDLYFGADGAGNSLLGKLDQIAICNAVPNTTDRDNLFNGGDGRAYAEVSSLAGLVAFYELGDPANTPTVSLSRNAATVGENGGAFAVIATLSNTTSQTVTVSLGYAGVATRDTDYTAPSTLTIDPGQLTASGSVASINDTTFEGSESIVIDIIDVTNGTENATQQVTITITDDETTPTVTLSRSSATIAENGGTAAVIATLSNLSTQDVTVNLSFSGTATNNVDYSRSTTSILVPAGSLTASAGVTAINDATFEGSETVVVDVSSVTNGTENGTQQVTITITDDDSEPTVTLSRSSATIAENGGTAAVIATLSNLSTQDVTVNLSFSGTATNNVDYSRSTTSILVPAGSLTASAGVTAINDATFEGSETVVVDVSSVTNGTENGTQQVTITITDDDSEPTVTLSRSSATIAENGGTAAVIATLSNLSTQDVTVNLSFSGTATNNVDYSRSTTSILVPAGSLTASAGVTAINDATFEGSETVVVDVSSVTNGTENGTQQVTITITDDDSEPTVTLSRSSATIAENGGTAAVIATLSNLSTQDVTVNLSFSGTATNNVDYSRSTTSILVPAGSLTASAGVTAINDATFEGSETVVVDVSSVTNGTENGTQQVTITITDDDSEPTVTLSRSSATIAENGGTAAVIATLSNLSTQDVMVNLSFSGTATNNVDYSRSTTSILVPAGSLTASAGVTAINDATFEGSETVVVDVSSVTNGTENGTQQVTITITDDDSEPTVTLSRSSATIAENGGTAAVIATLSNLSTQDVTVNLSFSGTATNNVDYSRSTTSILVPAGSLTASAGVTAINDATFEGSETVVVDVSSVTNGTENGTQQVTITITDDDSEPTVTLSRSSATIAENGGTAAVIATLSNLSTQDVTVNLSFSGTATNNVDYSRSTTSILVPAGSLTASAGVTAINDATFEGSETVVVDVSSVTNGTENGTQQVTITITDDDSEPTVTLSRSSATIAENGGTAAVIATLSNLSTQDVTVNLSFSGTATNNVDYSRSATSITVPAGATSASLSVTAINDATFEEGETIVVEVSSVTNGTENGTQQVTLTITDDELVTTIWTEALGINGVCVVPRALPVDRLRGVPFVIGLGGPKLMARIVSEIHATGETSAHPVTPQDVASVAVSAYVGPKGVNGRPTYTALEGWQSHTITVADVLQATLVPWMGDYIGRNFAWLVPGEMFADAEDGQFALVQIVITLVDGGSCVLSFEGQLTSLGV